MPAENELAGLKQYGAETVEPYPASLIESFRAIGYTLSSALADIIDNSISAGSRNVWVTFQWKRKDSCILIHDDGCGMTKDQLVEALRPGTHNPLADRRPDDLGRFGLGLKTASFSQCRIMTVLTKTSDKPEINVRAWNLDYVEAYKIWQILDYLSNEEFRTLLKDQNSGAIVIWEHLDKIVFDQDGHIISESKFFETIREVEQHLGMVFHRFIETGRLKLKINGQAVVPWDPFLKSEKAAQSFPAEYFAGRKVKVIGYVLPHASKIDAETASRGAGINGWNAQQGFYIYRKDRLLVAGDWLQMFPKKEYMRLARIMIEIDASLDFSWQLDIRKSRAIPPKMLRTELKQYASEIIKLATEVFSHRGRQKLRKADRPEFEFAWVTYEKDGREYYRINRSHPLVRTVLEQGKSSKKEIEQLLKLLEITLPIPAIVLNESRYSDQAGEEKPPVKDTDVLEMMKTVYHRLLNEGYSKKRAREELFYIDPFSDFPHLVESLDK
jgi:hypothetical protein